MVAAEVAWLGRLRVSELLERARSLGAHEHVLDELLDTEQPQAELIELIASRPAAFVAAGSVDLSADARELVAALAAAHEPDATQILSRMVEICAMDGGDVVERGVSSVHLELVAAGVVEVVTQLVADTLAAGPPDSHALGLGSLVREGMLVLATLAAKRESAAWFSGTGTIAGMVAAMGHAAAFRSPPKFDNGVEQPDVEALAASALANLAYPPDSEEGSNMVAKEIISVGAVNSLLNILPGRSRTAESGGTMRAQQWAAAALCNISMHGCRARKILMEAEIFPAVSAAVTSQWGREGSHVEGRAVTSQLLLGCLTNLTAFHEEPAQLLVATGTEYGEAVTLGLESALTVLVESRPPAIATMAQVTSGSDSGGEDPCLAAATALLVQMAESCGGIVGEGTEKSDAIESGDSKGVQLLSELPHRLLQIALRTDEGEKTEGLLWSATRECAEIMCVDLDLPDRSTTMGDEQAELMRNDDEETSKLMLEDNVSSAARNEEAEMGAATRIQARQRGRSARRRLAAGPEENSREQTDARTPAEPKDGEQIGLSEEELLKVEMLLEERHEAENRRLQELMKSFKRHDTGSGKVSKDDLVVRACV